MKNNQVNIFCMLCACGCGKRVSKPENQYVYGHNGRIHSFPKSRLCECGCSQLAKPERRYVWGHQRIGKYHSKETKRKMSKSATGKTKSKETKRRMSKSATGKVKSKEHRRKLRESLIGIPHSKERIEKNSRAGKRRWQNPEYREKQLKAIFAAYGLLPTKPERRLRNRLNHLFPNEYKYVGDGDTFIGRKCPDFVNINGQKKVIEMFGDYWHSKKVTGRTKRQEENQRIKHFAKYGYETLIVWESKLKNISKLKEELIAFHSR